VFTVQLEVQNIRPDTHNYVLFKEISFMFWLYYIAIMRLIRGGGGRENRENLQLKSETHAVMKFSFLFS